MGEEPAMVRGLATTLILLLLTVLSGAQESSAKLTVVTDPPGAKLYLDRGNPEPDYLGPSGEPVTVSWKKGTGALFIQARKDGFHTAGLTIPVHQLRGSTTWPTDGSAVVLNPTGLAAKLTGLLQSHPALAGAGVLFLLTTAAIGFSVMGRFRRSQQREKTLERFADAAEDESASLVMNILGGYRLVSVLGRGGMATVYRAIPEADLDESREVACKVIKRELSQDPESRARFEREIRVCQQLDHPNIVRLVDWGDFNGLLYLTMEVVKGTTLRAKMEGGLSDEEAANILVNILRAVHFAHEQQVVHRDLKPENIMITESGLVKIMDFGLARAHDTHTITATATMLGTPGYMPPEQIQSQGPDAKGDQYALGIIAYEMMAGEHPFQEEDPLKMIFKHLSEVPPAPTEKRSDLPPELDHVIMRMIEKSPEKRFSDLRAANEAFQQAVWPV